MRRLRRIRAREAVSETGDAGLCKAGLVGVRKSIEFRRIGSTS